MAYTGKEEPVKWVKVHNLPDHVFFSHAQHVAVGQYVSQVINYYRDRDEKLDEAELAYYIRQYLAWVQETFGKVTLRDENVSFKLPRELRDVPSPA